MVAEWDFPRDFGYGFRDALKLGLCALTYRIKRFGNFDLDSLIFWQALHTIFAKNGGYSGWQLCRIGRFL